MKKLFCCLIISTFFPFTSCYDDGPLISFRGAESRVDGTYNVEKFEVGGADSTVAYKSKPCYHPIRFTYNNDNNPQGTIGRWVNIAPCHYYGKWWVNKDNINLEFNVGVPEMGPWGGNNEAIWEVKELKDKEMTFEIKSNNITYKIKLKEI